MRQLERIIPDHIAILPGRRAVDDAAVDRLAESIKSLGLRTPITVRVVDNYQDDDGEIVDGQPILVTGAHRLEAVKRLGWERVECFVFEDDDETAAKLWEIAENLHRADLTVLERAQQVAEWVRLTEERQALKSAQLGQKSKTPENPRGAGRKESGTAAASRELGLSRTSVQRASAIDAIPEEAKQAAVEAGLDNNQSALERIAKSDDPVSEVETIVEEKKTRARPEPPEFKPEEEKQIEWTAEDESICVALEAALEAAAGKPHVLRRALMWHGRKIGIVLGELGLI